MKCALKIFVIIMAVLFMFSGCIIREDQHNDTAGIIEDLTNRAIDGKESILEGDSGIDIGIVMDNFDNAGWIAIFTGIIKKAIDERINVSCFSAGNDPDKQIELINQLIDVKVDGIIFVPVNSEKLSVAVDAAREKNIPIVTVDRSVTDARPDALVESDNIEIGRKAAEEMYALSQGKELKIFILQGDLVTSAGFERNEGFIGRIETYNNCSVVGSTAAQWRADLGYNAVLQAFRDYPDINAIYLPSDLYTQGTIAALEILGKLEPINYSGHIIIVSVDGHPVGLENIRKEYIDIDVGQPLYTIGQTAMDMCIRLAKGETPAQRIIRMQPQVIKKENVDSEDLWANIIE